MEENLSLEDKRELLKLARKVIESLVLKNKMPEPHGKILDFTEKRGVFVTLNRKKQLMGCIGNILPEKELYLAIMDNARSSAFHDPRFMPLEPFELDEIEIEISILSVPEKIDYMDEEDLKKKISPFEHGVILSFGMRKSTFLPQVWDELSDFESFMAHLSLKAGLDEDAWKKYNPVVEIYKADHFSESDLL